jgi:hypothetical protein
VTTRNARCGGCGSGSGSYAQGLKSTLLDAAMKVETSTEGICAIGGVMREIRAEEGCSNKHGFVVLCGWLETRERSRREEGRERTEVMGGGGKTDTLIFLGGNQYFDCSGGRSQSDAQAEGM